MTSERAKENRRKRDREKKRRKAARKKAERIAARKKAERIAAQMQTKVSKTSAAYRRVNFGLAPENSKAELRAELTAAVVNTRRAA